MKVYLVKIVWPDKTLQIDVFENSMNAQAHGSAIILREIHSHLESEQLRQRLARLDFSTCLRQYGLLVDDELRASIEILETDVQ